MLGAAGCGSSEYARRRDADRMLSARVDEQLASVPAIVAARVAARSHGGIVALVGEAPDENVRREAERVARGVPGVARVDNLILVVKGDPETGGSAPAKGAVLLARTE
jgi:osmotically-inducible protein OsmY